MILAVKLSTYIVRYFLLSFFTVFAVFSSLILMVDSVELLRKASDKNIPMDILFSMLFFKIPFLLQVIMPFIILISAVLAYSSMARKSELVVMRAAGVSVWEFLFPSIFVALAIGLLMVGVINPVSAYMYSAYERLDKKYINKQDMSSLQISESGLWIRQQQRDISFPSTAQDERMFGGKKDDNDPEYDLIIHADGIENVNNVLKIVGVQVFAYTPDSKFYYRIDAPSANLMKGFWRFEKARIQYNDNRIESIPVYDIPTIIEYGDIQKSFDVPEAVSFWKLSGLVKKLEKSGFNYLSHLMQWHKIISWPFFYISMVMIGAIFCLKSARHLRFGYSVTMAIVIGFFIYFISNLISSLGLSGTLPVFVAAWAPIIITLLVGIGLVLHYEDG